MTVHTLLPAMLLVACCHMPAASYAAPQSPDSASPREAAGLRSEKVACPSVKAFLTSDGRLDQERLQQSHYEGPLDLSGLRIHLRGEHGEPVFRALSGPGPRVPGDENWSSDFGHPDPVPGVYGFAGIYCLAIYEGDLIAAGSFYQAGDVGARNIARWDGIDWHPLGAGINDDVLALAVFEGELIAGGDFSEAGEVEAGDLAAWNGTSWRALDAGLSGPGDDEVYALAVHAGRLVVGGDFIVSPGGPYCVSLISWDGEEWDCVGGGVGGSWPRVYALTVYNGDLIVGGSFASAGGIPVGRIARWDDSEWHPLGAGVSGGPTGGQVRALTVYEDDLVVGGIFTIAGAVPANHIARWNGAAWDSLGSGVSGSGDTTSVYALSVCGGALLAGGYFTQAGGQDARRVARWVGDAWSGLGSGITGSVEGLRVVALACHQDQLIAGGRFDRAGATEVSHIARWDGYAWGGVGDPLPGNGLLGDIQALLQHAGDVVAGGSFTRAGSAEVQHIARWDGANWTSLGDGFCGGPYGTSVSALTTYEEDLIAGGDFHLSGDVEVNNIARWNGSAWGPIGPGFDGRVFALVTWGGGLIAGGEFSAAGGVGTNGIARWDGAAWSPLGQGIDWYVSALEVYDGDLIAGGQIHTAGGLDVNNIARWDGAAWHPLGEGATFPYGGGHVDALTTYQDLLIAGGSFSQAGGVEARCIASWDGSTWAPVGQGVDETDYPVLALTALENTLYAGGIIPTMAGVEVNDIARWDGATWRALGSGVYGGWGVEALCPVSQLLYAGGGFRLAGGKPSYSIGLWSESSSVALPPPGHGSRSPLISLSLGNPYRPHQPIELRLERSSDVKLSVIDVEGRQIHTIFQGALQQGAWSFAWDGSTETRSRASRGIYYLSVRADERRICRQFLLLP